MRRNGTRKFTDAAEYQAAIRGPQFDLVFTCQKEFEAQLTSVKLRHLRLLRGQENLPRVANISLPPDVVLVAFPMRYDSPQIYDGTEVRRGDIVFHSGGERIHHWTRGSSQWGIISLKSQRLADFGKALAGSEWLAPSGASHLHPPRPDTTRLLRLYAKVCRLAETRPELISQPEVARALEQDVIYALVHCLATKYAKNNSAPRRHHMNIIARFEEVVTSFSERRSKIPALCNIIGVSERTLRTCCREFLGMSPNQYLRLRHLNMVHAALRHTDTPADTVAEFARRFGFWELGRFAGIYKAVFGEAPSTTLRSARADQS
jgi:AraC-like DNA-binding protein